MLIELAGRRVGGDIGVGAGHLALFLTDDAGDEFVLSAYTDSNLLSGDLYVETYEGSAWVPQQMSTESQTAPALFDRIPLDLGNRTAEDVAALFAQYAHAINAQSFDYLVLSQNSNSVIATLLDLVGISAQARLPNPPDVGWLGFVAVDALLTLSFQIDGSTGNDFIQGRDLPQVFDGRDGNDTLKGGAGGDILTGGRGADVIDGGSDVDTAVYSGAQSGFTLTVGAAETIITDRRGEVGEGRDLLKDIELLDFGAEIDLYDGPMNLAAVGAAGGLPADVLLQIVELYVAYFNRAPDAIGLNYWATEFAKGYTLPEMALSFFVQDETRATYASVLDSEFMLDLTDRSKVGDFVTEVYDNVLGRAPDVPGFNYWVNELESNPDISPGIFILAIINGAKFPSEPTELTVSDQAYLSTKADIGAYFSVIKGMSDVEDAAAAMALFDDSDTSVQSAVDQIDQLFEAALDPVDGAFLFQLIGVLDDPFVI